MKVIKKNGDILELTVQEYKELYKNTDYYNYTNFYCPGYYWGMPLYYLKSNTAQWT